MIESNEDLFAMLGNGGHVICIATNCDLKKNGDAVMGKGSAARAAKLLPGLPAMCGDIIRRNGRVPQWINFNQNSIIMLPTKLHWWEDSNVEYIENAINFIHKYSTRYPDVTFHLPRLGCGYGRMTWTVVKSLFEAYALPDNVVVHHREGV